VEEMAINVKLVRIILEGKSDPKSKNRKAKENKYFQDLAISVNNRVTSGGTVLNLILSFTKMLNRVNWAKKEVEMRNRTIINRILIGESSLADVLCVVKLATRDIIVRVREKFQPPPVNEGIFSTYWVMGRLLIDTRTSHSFVAIKIAWATGLLDSANITVICVDSPMGSGTPIFFICRNVSLILSGIYLF